MSTSDTIHVVGISGSLRKASLNSALLRAAGELLPEGMTLETAHFNDFPLYDQDLVQGDFPDAVKRFCAQIAKADAVLFSTPEYNYSIPGGLKNAMDWASRLKDQPFANKPAAIMGASPGNVGTARAQYHLRQVCVFLNVHVLNRPEVMVSRAAEKFDTHGNLTDEATRKHIRAQLEALAAWTRLIQKR